MYIRNKVLSLRENGWMVDVILAQRGKAKLSELQEFDFVIPELSFEIFNYSKKTKERVINEIVNRIQIDFPDEVVIESTCISESSWAEAVAERLGAKHISFLLQEENIVRNSGMQKFFAFKHARKELFGISETSLQMMFESFSPISKEESYWLPAYCNNVEADVDSPFIHQMNSLNYDYLIGMLSRLDKPFVLPAITDFYQYAQKHQDKKFVLLLMGDAPKDFDALEQIKKILNRQVSNVTLIATGYMYPVPTRLMEKCDAFFTSAGSSWTCMRSGVPTITYDGNDLKPIGILGRTTMNPIFRGEDEPQQDFSELMKQILEDGIFKKEIPHYEEGLPDFSNHFESLSKTSPVKEYYNVEAISLESLSDYKLKWALAVIGPQRYLKLGSLKQRWS